MILMPASEEGPHKAELALGAATRMLREYKGLTRAELAERAGLDEKTVIGIEDGNENPLNVDTLFRLTTTGLSVRFGELGHLIDQHLGGHS